MTHPVRRLAVILSVASIPVMPARGQVQPQGGIAAVVEDSVAARHQVRDIITELRDTLYGVGSVQNRLARARRTNSPGVVMSQARELARQCLIGVAAIDRGSKRLEVFGGADSRTALAMSSYRTELTALRESLRLCAHYDSLTLAAKPVDDQRLENIATAASEAIEHHDRVRDTLLKTLGISLPIRGTVWRGH